MSQQTKQILELMSLSNTELLKAIGENKYEHILLIGELGFRLNK